MRKGYDNSIVVDGDGQVLALALGADFTSEHEWGIDRLYDRFGVDRREPGVKRRSITRGEVFWFESSEIAGFSTIGKNYLGEPYALTDALSIAEAHLPTSYGTGKNRKVYYDKLQTAWDEGSLAAFSADKTEQIQLREVFDAINRHDATLSFQYMGWTMRGLVIGIRSRLPQAITDAWMVADLEQERLEKVARDSGIKERLKQAGIKYHALSPRFTPEGLLIFWLNPCHQDRFNHGWFTVKDLDEWIAGTGPIVKQLAAAER